jgi:hypothetical protein
MTSNKQNGNADKIFSKEKIFTVIVVLTTIALNLGTGSVITVALKMMCVVITVLICWLQNTVACHLRIVCCRTTGTMWYLLTASASFQLMNGLF